MPDLDRYLRRFRRLVAPPGRPGRPAVPSDQVAGPAAELNAVFEEIDRIAAEADRIRADAEERAETVRRQARARVDGIVEDGRERAESARAEAASRRTEQSDAEIAAVMARAGEEADRIERVSSQRLPDFVDRIVDQVVRAGPVGAS